VEDEADELQDKELVKKAKNAIKGVQLLMKSPEKEEALLNKKQDEDNKKLEEAKKKQEEDNKKLEEAKKKQEEDNKKQEEEALLKKKQDEANKKEAECQKSYYDCLGVNRNATQDNIRKAYLKLSLKFHTDKNKFGTEAFKMLNEAKDVLMDAEKKNIYDNFNDHREAKYQVRVYEQNQIKKKTKEEQKEEDKKKANWWSAFTNIGNFFKDKPK
jgi:hypothetical protein